VVPDQVVVKPKAAVTVVTSVRTEEQVEAIVWAGLDQDAVKPKDVMTVVTSVRAEE
jgi:hypothetical protein